MAVDICRFCLRPADKANSTDLTSEPTKSAMLKEFVPEMNLDIFENTQVCSNCIQKIEASYNFKHGVVVNKANIQAKLEENGLKKINLKLMLDDVAKKELKDDDYVCQTCLSICRNPSISLFESPSNMMPYSFVRKICQVVFELELIDTDKPVLCDACWEIFQTVYKVRKCCLKTDKNPQAYITSKLIVSEFKKFVEENPIDEDNLKFDPEEASCSSALLKLKEETTVKSESELNSDTDMEDEPELLDPKALKSEITEFDGADCKMEIGDLKVDADGEGAAGPSGYRCMGGGPVAKRAVTQQQRTIGRAALPIFATPSPPRKSMPLWATQTGDYSSDEDMFAEAEKQSAMPDLLSPSPNIEHRVAARSEVATVLEDVEPVVTMVEEPQLSPPVLHLPDVSPTVEFPPEHEQLDGDDTISSQTVVNYVEGYARDVIKHARAVNKANKRMETLQLEMGKLAAEKERLLIRLQSIEQALQTNKQALHSALNERDSVVTRAKH